MTLSARLTASAGDAVLLEARLFGMEQTIAELRHAVLTRDDVIRQRDAEIARLTPNS